MDSYIEKKTAEGIFRGPESRIECNFVQRPSTAKHVQKPSYQLNCLWYCQKRLNCVVHLYGKASIGTDFDGPNSDGVLKPKVHYMSRMISDKTLV